MKCQMVVPESRCKEEECIIYEWFSVSQLLAHTPVPFNPTNRMLYYYPVG